MEKSVSLESIKKYFDTSIAPCSIAIPKLFLWEKLTELKLISRYTTTVGNLNQHVAKKETCKKTIEASSGSDELLLEWLELNGLSVIVRDFARDKNCFDNLLQKDSLIIMGELFYKLSPRDLNARLKLSLAKSWIFFGFILKSDQLDSQKMNFEGIVMGIHRLDSYLIITRR